MTKMWVDLKFCQLNESFTKEYEKNISDLTGTIKDFFDVFEKFKKTKPVEVEHKNEVTGGVVNKDHLVNYFKYVSKSKFLNAEGEANKIANLEEEIRILKQENRFKQQHMESIMKEAIELKKKIELIEANAIEYQKNTAITYDQELENHILSFDILKNFYAEEINMAKNMINGLNAIIDEFICNKDFYALDQNRKKFSDCYLHKAKSFMNNIDFKNEEGRYAVLKSLHEKFIIEEGNASKKLQIFLDEANLPRKDSGLNCTQSAKGPIRRIFKSTLEGDNNDDIWALDV